MKKTKLIVSEFIKKNKNGDMFFRQKTVYANLSLCEKEKINDAFMFQSHEDDIILTLDNEKIFIGDIIEICN
jgi:hypothetical protein